jgi:hypothetical protein
MNFTRCRGAALRLRINRAGGPNHSGRTRDVLIKGIICGAILTVTPERTTTLLAAPLHCSLGPNRPARADGGIDCEGRHRCQVDGSGRRGWQRQVSPGSAMAATSATDLRTRQSLVPTPTGGIQSPAQRSDHPPR